MHAAVGIPVNLDSVCGKPRAHTVGAGAHLPFLCALARPCGCLSGLPNRAASSRSLGADPVGRRVHIVTNVGRRGLEGRKAVVDSDDEASQPSTSGRQHFNESRQQVILRHSRGAASNILTFISGVGSRAAAAARPLPPLTEAEAAADLAAADAADIAAMHLPPAHLPPADHPTMQLLLKRWRESSAPGQRTDNFKLGLAVEGGGMRGIISGAMLMCLNDLGLKNVFDAVYGASAGAINATYFLSGQQSGLDIYIDHLASGNNFLDFSSLLRGEPVMKLDYLIDDVMRYRNPLDWQAVLDSPVPLKCVASSLDTLSAELIEGYTSEEELVEALKATATVPGFAGPPRIIRGQRLVDAAVFEAVPLRSAINDGCTHVLVLCTRPAQPNPPKGWRKRIADTVEHALKQTVLNPSYMREAWKVDVSIYQQHDEMLNVAAQSDPQAIAQEFGAYILPVQPTTTGGCHPLCQNATALQAGLDEGYAAMSRSLSGLVTPPEQRQRNRPLDARQRQELVDRVEDLAAKVQRLRSLPSK